MNATLLRTPLYEAHLRAKAKMVPYADYDMPVQYQSVIGEATAVRTGAGMFDVSHMARLRFEGKSTLEFLEQITSNDVAKLTDGHGHYSLLPNKDGGLVDDIIVYREGPDRFEMVVNGTNHQKDLAWIRSENTFGVEISDVTESTAMIAVQGPKAAAIVASLCDSPEALANAPFFSTHRIRVAGVSCFAPRSGYTGEDGFELICSASDAVTLWDALCEAGVVPCGLASRDILRVEAGLPLYGHELSEDINPISTGLGWVVSKTKRFNGSDEMKRARAEGTPMKLQGIRLESKRVADPESPVLIEDRNVGPVTSGVYSPTLQCGLAMAYLESDVEPGTPCHVEIRGKLEPAKVVSKRFYKRA